MKVKYIGQSFGIDSLTDGMLYDVVEVDEVSGGLRLIDDSGEDYLYSAKQPKPLTATEPYGRFEVIEDDENGSIANAIGL